ISLGHASRNAGVAWNNQSDRILRRAIGVRASTRVNRRRLSGTESLYMLRLIRQGGVQLPSQPVIQSEIRPYLPAILREQVQSSVANLFVLRRTLPVCIGKTQQEIGE